MTNVPTNVDPTTGAPVVQPKIDPLPYGTPIVKRFYADDTHYHIEVAFVGDAGVMSGSVAFVDLPDDVPESDAELYCIGEARKQRDAMRSIRKIKG